MVRINSVIDCVSDEFSNICIVSFPGSCLKGGILGFSAL